MEIPKDKKYKSFKEYYTNPEFKKKHLEYINARVKCECGASIVRCGLARHKRTITHKRGMEATNPELTEELEKKIMEKLIHKYSLNST